MEKKRGNNCLIEQPPLQSNMEVGIISWYGGVWGGMEWNGVGVLTEVQGIMDAEQYCEILDGGVVESFGNGGGGEDISARQ